MEDLHDEFEDADVRIVAISADGRRGAESMKKDEDLDFPVLYDVDCEDVRDRFGIYIAEADDRTHLQPAQFVLDPDGIVRLASYSSGKVGRLGAREALETVESERG